jgi:hypothetical protein
MNKVFQSMRIAFRALRVNKLRSMLTMLGIIIGVGAVIAMVSIGSGAAARIKDQIASIGANVIQIQGGSQNQGNVRSGNGNNPSLTEDDALAVLSACDTGLGKRLSGEGLVGLTRAFLYAGTAAVVVSLWQVEDRSTAELMVQLKENLDRGDDHAEALRQAKLGLIAGGRFAEPRLWAPFILVGDRAAVAPAGSG